jgi:DNA-binding NarL/FixJ family response regulator
MTNERPLRIAILNDYEIVVKGLARMFEPFADRVTVVEITANKPAREPSDIALYDTFSQTQEIPSEADAVLQETNAQRLVIYSWNLHPELIKSSLRKGASGYLAKRLPAGDLVAALERVHAGEQVVTDDVVDPAPENWGLAGAHAGTHHPRVGDHRADHARPEQPADRRPRLPQHQLGEVLHPVELPEDVRHQQEPGGAVGHRARLPPRPRAAAAAG